MPEVRESLLRVIQNHVIKIFIRLRRDVYSALVTCLWIRELHRDINDRRPNDAIIRSRGLHEIQAGMVKDVTRSKLSINYSTKTKIIYNIFHSIYAKWLVSKVKIKHMLCPIVNIFFFFRFNNNNPQSRICISIARPKMLYLYQSIKKLVVQKK